MSGGMQAGGMGGMAGMMGGGGAGGVDQLAQMMQNVPDDKLMALAQNVNPDAVQAALMQNPGLRLPDTDPGLSDIIQGKVQITPSPKPETRAPSLSPQALSALGKFGQDQNAAPRTPQAQAVAPASGRQVNINPSAYIQPALQSQRRLTLADLLGRR